MVRGKTEASPIKSEVAIRDYLAAHLDKIEEGLQLIKKEYEIRGLGVIDILCRNDTDGYFGIVEIKRDRVTASKLRDQLVRYSAAVRSEFSLHRNDVRCFVVGTGFDRKTRLVAGHLENVFLKRLVRRGRGYSLIEVPADVIPKITLERVLSLWKNRIVLRGWAFGFSGRDNYDHFVEQAKGWLDGRGYDALVIMFEPLLGASLRYHVEILTVSPDQYIGYSKLNGLVDLARKLARSALFYEAEHTDTGIIRFWYTKRGAPKITEIVPFGQLCGPSGHQWEDYLLKKPHAPYHSKALRWIPDNARPK